jgi:hypothetical protein
MARKRESLEAQGRRLAREFIAWAKTPEGERRLREGAARARRTCEALHKASQVPREKLYEPFTI